MFYFKVLSRRTDTRISAYTIWETKTTTHTHPAVMPIGHRRGEAVATHVDYKSGAGAAFRAGNDSAVICTECRVSRSRIYTKICILTYTDRLPRGTSVDGIYNSLI